MIETDISMYVHDAFLRAYEPSPLPERNTVKVVGDITKKPEPSVYDKFKNDMELLEKRFGSLTPGMSIIVTLTDLLTIVPRQRRRSDAYKGLINYLLSSRGVRLEINTNKKKII